MVTAVLAECLPVDELVLLTVPLLFLSLSFLPLFDGEA